MSFRAVTWAFDQVRGLSATEKLVLLALAEFANDDDETWRSRAAIAQRAECSMSSVERAIRTLRTHELLVVAGRYAWCGRESAACASRAAHKHRAGTTYRLRLDVTADVKSPSSQHAGATAVNLKDVAEVAEFRGNLHTCQVDGYGSTPVTAGVPHPSEVTAVLSSNPQLNPQTRPDLGAVTTDSVGSVGEDPVVGVAAPGGAMPHGTAADAELVVECLPDHLRALDASGLATVAALLRERLAAGWTAKSICALMDQPLPQKTSRLAGVVSYRLRENIQPALAPAKPARMVPVQAVEPMEDPAEEAWTDLVWSPVFWDALGDTTEYVAAQKETVACIERHGVGKPEFFAVWNSLSETMPATERGEAVLAILGFRSGRGVLEADGEPACGGAWQ